MKGGSAAFIEKVGCGGAADAAACLRGLPATDFAVAVSPAFPLVDGVVIPEQPLKAFETGRFARVPVIVGSTHDEGTNLVLANFPEPAKGQLSVEGYLPLPKKIFGPNAAAVAAQYPADNYPIPLQAFAAVVTDSSPSPSR